MDFSIFPLIEAVMLAGILSADAFVASFAYGSNGINIPMRSVQTINLICAVILALSLYAGTLLRPYLTPELTIALCFFILTGLGLFKLFDSLTKTWIRKHSEVKKQVHFSMFNFRFILKIYADPEVADVDTSKTISPLEASALAAALSLDSVAVGFGAAMGGTNGVYLVVASLVTNCIAVMLGCYLGNRIAGKLTYDISWISGFLLIALAVLKLF